MRFVFMGANLKKDMFPAKWGLNFNVVFVKMYVFCKNGFKIQVYFRVGVGSDLPLHGNKPERAVHPAIAVFLNILRV